MVFNIQTIKNNTTRSSFLLATICLILLTVTLQDLIHSQRHQYRFYLSESLLFNSYWIWFFFIAWLVRHFSFHDQLAAWTNQQKLSVFVMVAAILHASFYSVTVYLVSFFLYEATYDVVKMFEYTMAQDLYKYVFGYIILGCFLYQNKADEPTMPEEIVEPVAIAYPETITASLGQTTVVIPIQDIQVIHSETPYLAIHTASKKYLRQQTLKALLTQLPKQFIQVHKSSVVNLSKVISIKSRLNGDYDILLDNQQQIRLSRNYARRFKEALKC